MGRRLGYYLRGLWRHLNEEEVFLWAGAIAFKVLVTFLPVIVLFTGIFGLILRSGDPFEQMAGLIRDWLPAYQTEQAINFMQALQQSSGTVTGLGALALIFSVVTLFTTLRAVVAKTFSRYHRIRPLLRGYLFDLRMGAQVGVLFLISIGLSFVVSGTSTHGTEFLHDIGADWPWLLGLWQSFFRFLAYLVPLLITMVMFFQMYYFVPRPHPPFRSALAGALVTGIGFEIMKSLFTFYATNVGRFDQYTLDDAGEEAFSSLGSFFGLMLALVFWVYYSGLLFIIGAKVAELNEALRVERRTTASTRPVKLPIESL